MRGAADADPHRDGHRAAAVPPRAEEVVELLDLLRAGVRVGLEEQEEELVVLPAEEVVRLADVPPQLPRGLPEDGDGRLLARVRESVEVAITTETTESAIPWRRDRSSSRAMTSSKYSRT